jgi:restriction system protein
MDILTLAGYCSLTPDGFEGAVAEVLDRLGWSTMRVVGATRDLGLDVLAHDPLGHVAAIQCKRRLPGSSVGSLAVQQLLASVQIYRADRGLIFTTASFSPQAIEYATRMDVELVDGSRLTQLAHLSEPDNTSGVRDRTPRAALAGS